MGNFATLRYVSQSNRVFKLDVKARERICTLHVRTVCTVLQVPWPRSRAAQGQSLIGKTVLDSRVGLDEPASPAAA
jgi:hypothetical protein